MQPMTLHLFVASLPVARSARLALIGTLLSDCTPATDCGDPANETCCQPAAAAYQSEIAPLVSEYCGACHGETPLYGATFPLTTYEELTRGNRAEQIVHQLESSTMPPGALPHPPSDVVEELLSWASCGKTSAPVNEGLVVSAPPYLSPEQAPPGLEQFALTADTFPVGATEIDRYRCFVFEMPSAPDRFVRRFEPFIDQAVVVHHMVLLRDRDGTAPSSDYDCLGSMPAGSEYLYTWAPGQGAFEFPTGGLRVASGERLVLQIHYNNALGVEGLTDSSGVQLYLDAPEGPEYGQVAMGPIDFVLPPHQTTTLGSRCTIKEPMSVLAGMPHMHTLGETFSQTITRSSGAKERLIELSGWDFATQLYYHLPVELYPGDVVETAASLTNTTGSVVQAGPNTNDEMCFNFLYVTPPIGDRYCDDEEAGKPTDVLYETGECGIDSDGTPPLVTGGWIEGAAPTLQGGVIPEGSWVLDAVTFYVSNASTPVGEIDLDETFMLGRGRATTSDQMLTLDYAMDVYLKTVDGPVFGGFYPASFSGPYTPAGTEFDWAPDCPAGQPPSHVAFEAAPQRLIVGFTTDDIPGEVLEQRFEYQLE